MHNLRLDTVRCFLKSSKWPVIRKLPSDKELSTLIRAGLPSSPLKQIVVNSKWNVNKCHQGFHSNAISKSRHCLINFQFRYKNRDIRVIIAGFKNTLLYCMLLSLKCSIQSVVLIKGDKQHKILKLWGSFLLICRKGIRFAVWFINNYW